METKEKELKQQLIREIAHVVHDKGKYSFRKAEQDFEHDTHTYTLEVPENGIIFYCRFPFAGRSLTKIEVKRYNRNGENIETVSFYNGEEINCCHCSENYTDAISLDRLEKVADLIKNI